jgi:4a-hydroxytetrahydrobiopterin dehydratase
MPAAPLLSEVEIRAALDGLPGWELREARLVKTFRFRGFPEAVGFVDRLVEPAETMDHHPDVSIHWRDVELSLWTHVAGGVTQRDLRLAQAIEELAGAR